MGNILLETAKSRANAWLNAGNIDTATRETVAKILQNEEQLISCFGQELSFGTGGLRGIIGVGTNRMNPYTVARASRGFAEYIRKSNGGKIAISYDSRHFSREFAEVASGVFAACGIRVYLYDRLMPTPMLSYAVRVLGCDAGVMITASHNPAEYNGYKVYGADGCQVTDSAAAVITALIESTRYDSLEWLPFEDAVHSGIISYIPGRVFDSYMERTLDCRVDKNANAKIRIAYTPLNGTGLEPVLAMFSKMPGIEVAVVEAQRLPDGNFPTCPRPNPELPAALALGLEKAAAYGADLLLATDPDCDRVGAAIRTQEGSYRILTGNEAGLLLLEYLLKNKKTEGVPVCIKTIVTSDMTFSIAEKYGAQVIEVLTGFKYIGEMIEKLEKENAAGCFLFGFEESCGYLAGTHVRDKDGVMACMLIAEMAQHYALQNITLEQALKTMYETYGYTVNRTMNFDISGAVPMARMSQIMLGIRDNPIRSLAGKPVKNLKDYLNGLGALPPSDILSIEANGCKAIIRPSGTEPKLKAYISARANGRSQAEALLDTMENELQSRIQ